MDTFEKKYNEALNDMRAIYPNLKGDAKLAVEHAFPELRESEDERIRKALIDLVSTVGEYYLKLDSRNKMLAYLEKQKEPKLAPDDLQKSFEAGQKSIVDNPEQYGLCKKAEWSEEDKDNVAQYLHDRDGGMLWSKATEITSDILDILRPRPSWKPSEEQMDALKELIDDANRAGWETPGATELYEDLKKLNDA